MKRKYEKILEENPRISASNALTFLKSVKHMGEENIKFRLNFGLDIFL